MKKLIVILSLSVVGSAYADGPVTSCPSGYTMVTENSLVVQDGACPAGYTSAGTTDTCLVASPSGVCFMYAPANTNYTNGTGTYQFTSICPMS